MRKTFSVAVLAGVFLLAGCTGTGDGTPTFTSGPVTATVTPSPTTSAGPVEVTAAPAPETDTAQEAADFLVKMQLALDNWGVTLNADEVRAASDYVCDELAAGTPADQITALVGDVPSYANADFVDLVQQGYCPVR